MTLSVANVATKKVYTIIETSEEQFNNALQVSGRDVTITDDGQNDVLGLSGTCNGCGIQPTGCMCTLMACTADMPQESFVCGVVANKKNIDRLQQFDKKYCSIVLWKFSYELGNKRIAFKLRVQWIRLRLSTK